MAWSSDEYKGFVESSNKNVGQISHQHDIGKIIHSYAADNNLVNFLEIGTWNGLGSTKCFIEGFKNRNSKFNFYSLECNTDKYNFAKKLYENIENVHILNEVILNEMPSDIYDIFPILLTNKMFKSWNDVDFENMKNKNLFLNRDDVPDFYDVILLDGGEFTTYYEYNKLKDKCKFLLLDDTNTNKCVKIVEEIKSSNNWKILFESNERNGILVCERIH
jgi:hypothetical protein